MACLQPGVQMSEEESACCREMAGKCGEMGTNSTHSCCQTVVRQDEVGLASQAFTLEHKLLTDAVMLPVSYALPVLAGVQESFLSGVSPPGSPPSPQITVLRL
jgi:hypothetical protein